MVFVNEAYKVDDLPVEYMEGFVKMISPIMPHVAEELWSKFNESETIAYQKWPTYDPAQLIEDEVEVVVQINGKVKGHLTVAKDAAKDVLETQALADEHVKDNLVDKTVRKVIVVPNKIVNIVAN